MKRKKIILGMAVCVVALASNLNYARGGYGASIKDLRGGNKPPCTATDANGNPMECDKIPFNTSMTEMCLLYQYTVRVTHHNCLGWRKCKKGTCENCNCLHTCHCATGGNSVTLNYYFSSGSCSKAYAAADSFKTVMLQDDLNEVDSLYANDYSFQYVPTEIPVTECNYSPHSTCLPETGLCPTLEAS